MKQGFYSIGKYNVIALVFSTMVSLAIRIIVPISPLYRSTHDDGLMLNYALNLKNGNWLGSYSDLNLLTLAKAPGYSLFLTLNSYTNFSPPVFLHFFLILSTLIIILSFNRLKVNQTYSTIFYCFVVLNPIWRLIFLLFLV